MPAPAAPMSRTLSCAELTGKYRKTSFFINRGLERIVKLEEIMLGVVSRMEATEKAVIWALENWPPELHPDEAKMQEQALKVLRDKD